MSGERSGRKRNFFFETALKRQTNPISGTVQIIISSQLVLVSIKRASRIIISKDRTHKRDIIK